MTVTVGWCREPRTAFVLTLVPDAEQRIKQAKHTPSLSHNNNISIYESVHKGEHRSLTIRWCTPAPV